MTRKATFFVITLFLTAATVFGQEADALASYRRGRDLENAGRTAESNANYNEAVRICMDEINTGRATMDTYTVLTWTLQRQKKYSDVISWGQRALAISRDYRVIETMGEAYFYLNNYAASLKSMQQYVDALPQGERVPTAYFFIGEIYRAQGKFRRADIAYTTAVRLESNSPLWWYRLGLAREAAGEARSAIEAFERSLRLNPGFTQAQEALGRVRARSG